MPTTLAQPLFQTVLGPAFVQLPEALQRFHRSQGSHRFAGRYSAPGAETGAGHLLARLMGLPGPAQDRPFTFELEADAQQELWQRHFTGKTMRSRMRLQRGVLVEQLGPVCFHFALAVEGEALVMLLQGVRVLGLLPLPRFLLPAIVARETAAPGRLHFQVEARMPGFGRLAGYQGYLEVPEVPEVPEVTGKLVH